MSMIVAKSDIEKIWAGTPQFQRAVIRKMCRNSFPAFFKVAYPMLYPGRPVPSAPYVGAMLHKFEQLVTGNLKRLVCNVPPRHGKTEFGTVMLAAWILGNDPAAKIFVVSYGLALSEKITGKIRQLVEHPHYKQIFPDTRLKVGQNRIGMFMTTKGGECMACSQDSSITGFGTHYMLIDDFQKADEALSAVERDKAIDTFRNTLLSRFDNQSQGRILINAQRLHLGDISGFAINLGWERLCLPAIAVKDEAFDLPNGNVWYREKGDLLDPERCSMAYLEEQRLAQGNRVFSAQYQQEPDVGENCLIKMEWFGEYEEPPERNELLWVVQSWDPAFSTEPTADYSAGMTWGFDGENWYLLGLIRARLGLPDLEARIALSQKNWRADYVLIEGGSIGSTLRQSLLKRRLTGRIYTSNPTGSKEERLAGCTVQLAKGKFLLPVEANWLEELVRELRAFPEYPNDDQVDALTQFLDFIASRRGARLSDWDRSGRIPRRNMPPRRSRYQIMPPNLD